MKLARGRGAALVTVLALASAGAAQSPEVLDFSAEELRRIAAYGPWPTPWLPDPSNRVSGRPEAIEFGARLFFDARLSANGAIACASCHVPERHWTDGRPLGVGLATTGRNTPTVSDVRGQRWFGWAGAGDSLWAQSVRPLLDAREMGPAEAQVAALMRTDRDHACRYERVFGTPAARTDDETTLVNVAKALAAFQETIASGRTPFDDFRDALARGDRSAAARYPPAAQRGLRIFVGRGNCFLCHAGPAFTNGEFHLIGLTPAAGANPDPGRYEGIKLARASRFNLLRRHNDDAGRTTAMSLNHVDLNEQMLGRFRVPSLRNVALTAPYGHDGRLATLADVVRHYSGIDPERLQRFHGAHLPMEETDDVTRSVRVEAVLQPLRLSDGEVRDLVAFLESLTAPATVRTPHRPAHAPDLACR